MKRIASLATVLFVMLLLAGSASADRGRRHAREHRDHDTKARVSIHTAGSYAWVKQPCVSPNVPTVVRATPIYRGYSYVQPRPVRRIVVRRPVIVKRPVRVFPVRPARTSIFSITLSW